MIKNFKQLLYNPVCLSCGSYFVLKHLFCEVCYQFKISPRVSLGKKFCEPNLSSFHLIDWIAEESDLVSEMVYRFKSDKSVNAWQHYGKILLSELTREMDVHEIDCIVPIPGSTRQSIHSQIFATVAKEILQKPILNILKKSSDQSAFTEQKKRSKAERLRNSIEVCELITQDLSELGLQSKHVLVVDDILTSGSSFRQSIEAMGPVKKATLVTLFHRRAKVDAGLVS